MKLQKILLFLFVLPLTLFLDLILYAFVKTCPNCGSFLDWVKTEGALSFPLVMGLEEWLSQVLAGFKTRT